MSIEKMRSRFLSCLTALRESGEFFNEQTVVNLFKKRYPKTYAKYARQLDFKECGIPHHFSPNYKGKKVTRRLMQSFRFERKCLIYGRPICPVCDNKDESRFNTGRVSVLKPWPIGCTHKCIKNNPSVLEKRKETCRLKYGVDNVFKNEKVKSKIRKTMIHKYGASCIMKLPEGREQARDRWANMSDEARLQLRNKKIATNLRKRGVEFPSQCPKVRQKITESVIKKYGVSNPSQSSEVQAKIKTSWKRSKALKIEGRVFSGLQGYEPQALNWMVQELKIPVNTIQDNPSGIPYVDQTGKTHYYFPDFQVQASGETYCIEVKSSYTLGLSYKKIVNNAGSYTNLQLKYQGVKNTPFHYILVVMSDKYKKPLLVLTEVPSRNKLKRILKKALSVASQEARSQTPSH